MGSDSIVKKIAKHLRVRNGMCPAGHSLMTSEKKFDNQDAIRAEVRLNGRTGTIYFNPYYGRFEYECDLQLSHGDIVALFCPECRRSLEVDTLCRLCDIPMFAVQLPDGGQVEACPTVGCHNHSLKIVDLDEQLVRMYVHETKFRM